MRLENIEKSEEVIKNYQNAKTAYEGIARFEYQREEMFDRENRDTYGIEITVYPINSNQPPVKLSLQNRALEWSAIQIIKDAYAYHKKQVQSL